VCGIYKIQKKFLVLFSVFKLLRQYNKVLRYLFTRVVINLKKAERYK